MKNSILLILPWLPYPLKSGGDQALFNGINAIKDDYDVYLTYVAYDSQEYRKSVETFIRIMPEIKLLPLVYPEGMTQKSVIRKIKNHIFAFLRNKIHRRHEPISLADQWLISMQPINSGLARHLDSIFKSFHFDLIQVEMPWMIAAVLNLPEHSKRVFVHHEIGFVRHELEMMNVPHTPELKAVFDYMKIIEINLLNEYDTIITLSEVDKGKLIQAGVKKPIETSFAIVENSRISKQVPYTKTLSFIGLGSHEPNNHGLRWFLDKCWSKILERDNDYHLIIIGKWEKSKISELSSRYKNIEFKGYVDDLNSILQGTLMIVPILIGSGIRMKIIEAAMRGIPFISTSIGIEGLPFRDGYDCFIRDTPEGFISAIIDMENKDTRESFIANALMTAQSKFTSDALKSNRIQILERLLLSNKSH